MTVFAINTFRLRRGVDVQEFARFSADLDRPTCLAHDVVERFEVFLETGEPPRVVEVMGVRDWAEWESLRDTHPSFEPVLARFSELVDTESVSTHLTMTLDDVRKG
ncbi:MULTISPECIES: hypothetical protein [Actinomadura]|uniref:REDY-like protein HapK n=1 Tax=Actinomadura madurae TaxID=1993 RepID=A0A1I5EZT8_9ACTN|nr:hypothetical protein [Actinomadura madurae]SFO17034.1 hypothetical protein SAMN04489713_104359 [Actinomadura madurae]SPT60150.1 Uncharacterised protein [Actinomadura madurae]